MTIEKTVQHCWKPMEEYQLKDENLIDWIEGYANDRIEIMKKMKPNQYMVISSQGDIKKFNTIIELLKEKGLDVGKGNCEYGYKMPLPQNGDEYRQLIIFRRQL